MSSSLKFPPSAEIKRAIAAAIRAGIDIGSIDIHTDKIVIHSRRPSESGLGAYDLWKMSRGESTEHVRRLDQESDALLKKPRS